MKKFTLLFISILFFSSLAEGKNYKGGEYRTKEEFLYGRFEVSYIPAFREGVISSFFTYHEITSSTGWNEIDIEFVGRHTNIIQFNTITPGQKFHIRSNYLSFDPYADFHTYAFEWTPDYVAWFIDGEEVYRQTEDFVKTLSYPQKLMMNIWNPVYTNWVGYWNKAILPANSYYDWVSYYKYSPGSGDYGTGNNFSLEWKDDFDAFDETRWEKATHTFGGNDCDFIKENIVFEDGKMILCLTNSTNLGYTDLQKPEILWAHENYNGSIDVMFSEELDSASAVIPSKYLISGVTIKEVLLSPNKKSVKLLTENYNLENSYNLIVLSVSDDASPPNTMSTKAVSINKLKKIQFPFKVNLGGSAVLDYAADQEWNETVDYGYLGGDIKKWGDVDIAGTEDDDIFRVERKGLATYKFRVPAGRYNVKFLFSENDNNAPGARVFDVIAEGVIVKDNLDLALNVGKNRAYILEKEVDVEDEILDIYLPEEVDSSFANAIIVEQVFTDVSSNNTISPKDFQLLQNYPNPFNGYTNIRYIANGQEKIKLTIYDILGGIVYRETFNVTGSGVHYFLWNAKNEKGVQLNSGVYICQLSNGIEYHSQKLVFLK
ncbi:MAG: hypothetical protein CVV23_11630 [Ignavibacteriae bacterium HGW-Ignavibacteriae-2]|nr:MAG: hypothetical protein CVV23_11630 [Ignavibacteriae bacterium HGW-Ignavibacteriae-2]